VVLALTLTASVLAAQRDNVYRGDEPDAEGVTAVQQHSVFVEIVTEEQKRENETQIHQFAAVVGLVKECVNEQRRDQFDNAVLWFNDQFLFGQKSDEVRDVNQSGLGQNPPDNNLSTYEGDTGRYPGCTIPDGFAVAIGEDDPYGCGSYSVPQDARNASDRCAEGTSTNVDLVRQLIELDRRCQGCIFEYQSSFFVTDPNDNRWIVDKLVYPVSVLGNLFQEGEDNVLRDGDCASGNGTVPFSDPRDNNPHQDTCRSDGSPRYQHSCEDGDGECQSPEGGAEDPVDRAPPEEPEDRRAANATLVEPIYLTHQQVDPLSRGPQGHLDEALWEYDDDTKSQVRGMPRAQDESHPLYDECKTDKFSASLECSVEYTFLIAIDFEAFDDTDRVPGENEVAEDDAEHGEGAFPQPKARDGNSHPHNPQTFGEGPTHTHDTVNLDLFFTRQAPQFVTENAYWDEYGHPPEFAGDCSGVGEDANANASRESAIEARSPIVCDVDGDGPFHAHDGSETVDPD